MSGMRSKQLSSSPLGGAVWHGATPTVGPASSSAADNSNARHAASLLWVARPRRAPENSETSVDRDLVELAQRGDRDAFAVLVRLHGDRLFGIARRILRDVDLADDAVQQAFVVAWTELPTLRDPERFEAWATRILVRLCFTLARPTRSTRLHVGSLDNAAEHSAGDATEAIARRDQLERGFRRLPPEQRAVLVLRHYLGLEPTEIAGVLGIPAGTVRSRLHHAHREMRAALEADARLVAARGRPA